MKMLVKLYLKGIIAGEITIDDVPTKLQKEVQEELDKQNTEVSDK